MEEPKRTLTRQELYDLVWSVPIQTLAHQYKMSDQGLAKICHRHSVPIPGRGHWAKVTAGRKSKRTPLPVTAGSSMYSIQIGRKPRDWRLEHVLEVQNLPAGDQVQERDVGKPNEEALKSTPTTDFSNLAEQPAAGRGGETRFSADRAIRPIEPSLLDDMISQDELLELYPWLSPRILNKWRSSGRLRYFHGANSKKVFPRKDIEAALSEDLQRDEPDPPVQRSSLTLAPLSPERSARKAESDDIRESLSMRSIYGKPK